MKSKLNFGQRMLAIKLARQARQMEKVKEWFNPYVTKIKPEFKEATQAEIKKLKEQEQPKVVEDLSIKPITNAHLDRAIKLLRNQASNI